MIFKYFIYLLVYLTPSMATLADKVDIVQSLVSLGISVNEQDIHTTPIADVFSVDIKSDGLNVIYMSAGGRYLIQGEIVDLLTRRNLADNRMNAFNQSVLEGIDEKDKIIFKADNEKYIVHVFTDVDCPFCGKLHREIKKINALGITVKYLASPLAQLHPNAQAQMEKIWCAKDPVKALDDYKTKRIVPASKPCNNPVAKQLAIAAKLGVNGTPSIFLSNGKNLPGYLPANVLLSAIQQELGK